MGPPVFFMRSFIREYISHELTPPLTEISRVKVSITGASGTVSAAVNAQTGKSVTVFALQFSAYNTNGSLSGHVRLQSDSDDYFDAVLKPQDSLTQLFNFDPPLLCATEETLSVNRVQGNLSPGRVYIFYAYK